MLVVVNPRAQKEVHKKGAHVSRAALFPWNLQRNVKLRQAALKQLSKNWFVLFSGICVKELDIREFRKVFQH
jgi:hypothetical protein